MIQENVETQIAHFYPFPISHVAFRAAKSETLHFFVHDAFVKTTSSIPTGTTGLKFCKGDFQLKQYHFLEFHSC